MKNEYSNKKSHLIRRFYPYLKKYRKTMYLDLFCAALTCLCDVVLPLILRRITDLAMNDLAALTVSLVLKLSALYLLLRLIDETDMRHDAFDHLQKLGYTYYSNTKIGQIMGRITNDLFEVTEFAHHCPEEFFIAGLKFVVSFSILCTYNVWLTLLIFICVPLMAVVSVPLRRWKRKSLPRGTKRSSVLKSRPIILWRCSSRPRGFLTG